MKWYTSQTIDKIAPALLAAQRAMDGYRKDSDNPHYHSRYASLESTLGACKKALNDNGISILQPVGTPELAGTVTIDTALLHESGQYVGCVGTIPCEKPTPQGAGSAITYLRRYGVQALMCMAEADDDGEVAMGRPPFGGPKPAPAYPKDELAVLRTAFMRSGWNEVHLGNHLKKHFGCSEIRELTKSQSATLLQTLLNEAIAKS